MYTVHSVPLNKVITLCTHHVAMMIEPSCACAAGQTSALAMWWGKNGSTLLTAVGISVAGIVVVAVSSHLLIRHRRPAHVRTPTKPSMQRALPPSV